MDSHRVAKKIEYMHMKFGKTPGKQCRDCIHLHRFRTGNRFHSKCLVYGLTPSSASDWNGKYEACGVGAFCDDEEGDEIHDDNE